MGQPAYIPVSRAFLLERYATTLPADRVVLAVRPDLQLDRAGREALAELVDAGYRLALFDYAADGPLEPLLPLAHVAACNVAALGLRVVDVDVERLHAHGVRPLASGIEQHHELDLCRELGFDLFQGQFISKPRVVPGRGVTVDGLNFTRLLGTLHGAGADFDQMHEIIGRDVALSYNLLRFINSAFFSLPRRVDSIRDALVLLGADNVRRWATLMALAASPEKPRELVVTALVRARMCELLALQLDDGDPEAAFTTGLFSVVDALTDCSMVELLQSLPLSSEIIQALLAHDGPKGRILRATLAYETGNFAEVGELPPIASPLSGLYAQAVEWAADASAGLPGA